MNLPNKITISRILTIPVFLLFIIPLPESIVYCNFLAFAQTQLILFNNMVNNFGHYIAAIIFIIAASTDGVDGYIARKRHLVTNLGKFLDPIADKLLISAAVVALVQRGDLNTWIAVIILAREFAVTGLRQIAAADGIVIAASNLGKIKTISQIIAITLMVLRNFPFSLFTQVPLDKYAMFIAAVITVYSGYDYFAKNKKVLDLNS